MADPLIINPKLTNAGQQAALAASNQGVSLNLTHISFGQGKYDPIGTEVALKTPVSAKVTLAGGTRPNPRQLRMLSAWRENIGGEKPITEIGFWSNNVLVFIWSTAAGQSAFTKTDGVTAVHFVDLALSSVPSVNIAISVDPAESVALAALAAHEGASNAHPDYVKHSLFPDAQSDLFAEVVGGSANAVQLTMPDEVVLDAYRKGQVFRFVAAYTNTTTVTVNINGLGAKPVVKAGGNALTPSDIKVNSVYDMVYDGTRFQLNGGVGGGQFYIEYPNTAAAAKQTNYVGTYSPGSVMVFVGTLTGGQKLPQSSFTATDGQNVTLTAAAAANIAVGTLVTIVALSTFAVADTYTKGEYMAMVATQAQARDLASNIVDRWMPPQRVHEAVIARIQASFYDGAAGRLLVPGSFGMGALSVAVVANINTLTVSGLYTWGTATTGRPVDGEAGEVLHMAGDTSAYATQLVTSQLSSRMWFRRKSNNVWTSVELFHDGNQFALGTTDTTARDALKLGTAARADLTTGEQDSTIGSVLRVGDFGLGRKDLTDLSIDLNTLVATGFYFVGSASTNAPGAGISGMVIAMTNANNNTQQLFMPQGSARFYQRSSANGVWTAWVESWHSGNLVKTTSNTDSTIGNMLKVGDFGIGAKNLLTNNLITNIDDAAMANGVYAVSSTTTGTKPANFGILMQEGRQNAAGTTGRVSQTFIDVDQPIAPRIYHRVYIYANSAWGGWVEDWNSANLVKTVGINDITPGSMLKVGDFGLGVAQSMGANAIAVGTDLNNIVVSGLYGQAANANSSLALNYPVAKAGSLLVQRGSAGIVTQLYMEYDTGRIWSRGIFNGAASDWSMSWDTNTLVKTANTLDTTIGRMLKVGDFGFGVDTGIKYTFATDADWVKPTGWSGFIDVAASKAKGVTVPTAVGFTSNYGTWTILGRRDSGGGYMGIYTDYSTGRMWAGVNTVSTGSPTFQEIYSRANMPAFIQTLLDDATQAEAQATLGISAMINGVTSKTLSGSNVTLTAAEANVGVLYLTGALTANVSVIVPSGSGIYNVYNLTTGDFTVTIRAGAVGNAGVTLKQGRSAELVVIGTGISYANSGFGGGHFDGEVITTNFNSFRMVAGNFGAFWRNDGGTLYLMFTNSGDQYGNYNALRPFAVNLTTGKVQLNQGVSVPTVADGTATTDAASTSFVQNALAVYGLSAKSGTITDLNALRGTQFFGFGWNAVGAVAGTNYDAVGYQVEAGGQRTQWAVLSGGQVYVRTDDSADASGFDVWVAQATQDFVTTALANSGVGTTIGPVTLDLNTATTGGFYRTTSATANSPLATNLSVITAPYNSGGCLQIASQLGGSNRLFWRSQAGSVWTAWREIAGTDYADAIDSKGLGEISYYAMNTPPTGKLKANGAAVSRTTYAALFAKIGTQYGVGDGSTTFNLPDLRGYFLRGWDDGRGVDTGRAFGSTQASQNASHNHTGTIASAGAHTHLTTLAREYVDGKVTDANAVFGDQINEGTNDLPTNSAGAHTHTITIAASGGNEARPINVAMLACIQY
jgi:microcystin-dependent protein